MTTTATRPAEKTADEMLVGYAQKIRDWQSTRTSKLSDEALIRRYPSLGSTKTFKRILSGDTAELRVETWADQYRAVLEQIDEEAKEVGKSEELYDDLKNARAVRTAVASVVRSMGIERLVIVEGDTGSGKSSTLALIAALYPATTLDANVGWRSFASAMGDLGVALGVAESVDKLPVSASARLDAITSHIGESPRLILIDEAHHMTADSLNAIKHLINNTKARFVIAPQSTLWRKLQAASLQEVKQLLLNRLRARVYLGGPPAADVTLFLSKRCGLEITDEAASEIARTAARYGNYAFLRRLAAGLMESRKDIDQATALEITKTLASQLA